MQKEIEHLRNHITANSGSSALVPLVSSASSATMATGGGGKGGSNSGGNALTSSSGVDKKPTSTSVEDLEVEIWYILFYKNSAISSFTLHNIALLLRCW